MLNLDELWEYIQTDDGRSKLEKVGDLLQYVLPWGAFIVVALLTPHNAIPVLIANAIIAGIVSILKHLSNYTPFGERPNGGINSFPSGHTSGAFSGAATILWVFGWQFAVVPLLAAALTGLSRIMAKKHWLRDVIGGALIAIAVQYHFLVGPVIVLH